MVRAALKKTGVQWRRVLEPTCGDGTFLIGFGDDPSTAELWGVELQTSYVKTARERVASRGLEERTTILNRSLFDLDLSDLVWKQQGRLLVVGNPPWVTNSELGSLRSTNLPKKSNLKLLTGLEAITGSANFDLTEFVWIKVIEELRPLEPVVAFLCKTQVARNVLEYVENKNIGVTRAMLWRIDARKWFGASVDACLCMLDMKTDGGSLEFVEVFDSLDSASASNRLSFLSGELLNGHPSEVDVAQFLGPCEFEWRQGVKHDCAKVMELSHRSGQLINGHGEVVDVEPEFVFPLQKGTDLYHGRLPSESMRFVIVPQRVLGEDTGTLVVRAPHLWDYLQRHADALDQRKSAIYRTQPRFAVFGIGPYSFAPYKVAISGLHKEPRFRLLGPAKGRPVMVDDTCYLLSTDTAELAALLTAVLESSTSVAVLRALLFTDSKRPVKKRVLRRLNLRALLGACDRDSIIKRADELLSEVELRQDDLEWPSQLDHLFPQLPLFEPVA